MIIIESILRGSTMEARLEELKGKLSKSYNYEKKKLYLILKGMSEEEKELVLSDEEVLRQINRIENNDIFDMIFRMTPESIQEILWERGENQRRLLGITNIDFNDARKLNSDLYFSKERLRRIQLFVKDIKSSKILEDLTGNRYFQIIILFSDKIPTSILESINISLLYDRTIQSGVYDLANHSHKRKWVNLVNAYIEKIILPEDFRAIYIYKVPQARHFYYDREEENTIISMIKSKVYYLRERNQVLKINKETLSRLNIKELIFVYNVATSYDVTDKNDNMLVNKDEIENYFKELIDEHIKNGTIFGSDFFDLKLISHPFQYFVFSRVKECSLNDPKLESDLISYLYHYLFKGQYELEEQEMIKSYIKNSVLNTDCKDLTNLFNNTNEMKSVFHMRFNKVAYYMNYLDGIDIHQMMKVNVKQVNKIAKMLEDKTQDEISDIYGKAIRMYLVFGLDRTIAILRGDYGKIGKSFLDCVSKLEVKEIQFQKNGKKYEPILNDEFINFLFTGDNIFKILEVGSVFETTWFHLFNSFSEIKEKCRGHITIKQAEVILKEKTNKVKYEIDPDLYKLEDYLYEIGLGNKTKHSNEEIYGKAVEIYREQLKRKKSTIPYVTGTLENGYRYEMMRMDDPIAFVLGYKANCCMRVSDIGHNHLLHALHCQNGRILLTYRPNGALASFSPLKRNGELLIANSIEMIGEKADKNVAQAFQAGILAIMETSKETEGSSCLKVACIGRDSYLKPKVEPWPEYLKTPTIYEKLDEIYCNTDCYHKKLDIVAQRNGVNLGELKYGKGNAIYSDPRREIKSFKVSPEISVQKIELEKLIKGIDYHKKGGNDNRLYYMSPLSGIEYAFYNEDWYILISQNGKFYSNCIEENEDALKEMKATLKVISEIHQKKEIDAYVKSLRREVN